MAWLAKEYNQQLSRTERPKRNADGTLPLDEETWEAVS
jgi:hypothetical protein